MKLSVVIPARNEADSVGATVAALTAVLESAQIDHEVIVVDDASSDGTGGLVRSLAAANPRIRYERSPLPSGFGHAVRHGLSTFTGDCVAIVMADGSDSPEDLLAYHRVLEAGFDCAFGTRFGGPGKRRVHGYPRTKLVANRIVNWSIRGLFRHGYSDTTNAFKAYRREVVENISPLLSNHFNLTVELPLKAVVRGYSYSIVPISWTSRERGVSKLRLQEMGSRYLFIVLYVFLEHHLSRGDYRRPGANVERLRPAPMRTALPESEPQRPPSE